VQGVEVGVVIVVENVTFGLVTTFTPVQLGEEERQVVETAEGLR